MSKSVALVQTSSIVTIPNATRKLITGINCAGIISTIVPPELESGDVIVARNLKLSYDMARHAITGEKSAQAIIQGLAFCVVAFSHGNKNLDQLQAGAPDWAQTTLATICGLFKRGAGSITVQSLKDAVQIGVDKALTLGAPVSAKKKTLTAVTGNIIIEHDTTEESNVDVSTGRVKVHSLAFGHEAHEDGIRTTDVDLMAKPSIDAKAREMAIKLAKAQYERESVDVVRLVAELSNKKQAFQLVSEMALALGFTLIKIPAKKAA